MEMQQKLFQENCQTLTCANLSPCMGYVCGLKLGHDGKCDFGDRDLDKEDE